MEQKNKKSIEVPDDDSEQTDTGNNRRQTRSTTLRTKNSDNASELDGDRTITMKILRKVQIKQPMMNRITSNRNWILQLQKEGHAKEKQCQIKTDKMKEMKLQMMYRQMRKLMILFHCHICKKTFMNYNNFRAHKIKCWPTAKKHQCEKCGKGFDAKSIMQQHYDFRHTKKPKKFVCEICKKSFELKKMLDEHNMCLHSKGSYKFQL